MFNFISKLTEYVFGPEDEGTPSNSKNEVKIPDKSTKKATGSATLDVLRDKKQESLLRKSCYGKVTMLYDGAGVINDDVYFTFDVIVGGSRLEVGCEVHFEAARENVTSGWKATRVSCFKEWGTVQENGEIENIIGMATAIKGEILELNNELTFNMSVLKHQSFSPCKGDWVKVELERFRDDSVEIRGVKPLREKNLSGKVNSVSLGYGYINEEVYFTVGSCIRGYRPCRGDDVQVTAVESAQGKCKWRAVLVEPKRNAVMQNRNSPAVGTLQLFMGNKMAELLSDKHGLVITGPLDIGNIPMGHSRIVCVDIKNTEDKPHTFKSCSFVRADPQFEIQLLEDTQLSINQKANSKRRPSRETSVLSPGMEIASQETRCIRIKFTSKNLGRVKQLVIFTFECGEIGRHITSNVIDVHQEILAPVSPYQRHRNRGREAYDRFIENGLKENWIIPGERPTRKTKIFFPIKLKMYSIPKDIRYCIMEDRDLSALVPALIQPLSMQNHAARFSTLLYAEELQMEFDMREFDLQNKINKRFGLDSDLHQCEKSLALRVHLKGIVSVRNSRIYKVTMESYKEFLSLHVPGLSEGRPSLLIGDTVMVSLTDSSYDAPKYEGYIHEVRKDDVLLRFNEEFHNKFGLQNCDVTFYFNRSTIRRAHQAVEFASQLGPEVMFPRKLESKLPVVNLFFENSPDAGTVKALNKEEDFLYNSNLNERQRAAVSRILSGQCRPTPYVLFGPPGTGKTVTLVEAILQVFHRISASRIIACAPSNSAADLLAVRLHSSGFVQEGDMVRLNAAQRVQDIPKAIAPYCLDTDSLTLAAHYRIIISTCSTSGQLFSLGLRAGHFTHVFVDEAGQATEPDCLIPLGLAAGGEGQIILAGDPHQLGPVLRSTLASEHGLNISLLERLMSRPLYTRDEARFMDHGCYDPLLVTKLVNNYRSHPVLLHLPSALFYHNELQVYADEKMRERFCHFEMLPKEGVPLVFHGIKGEDLREGNSPSWFNPAEAVQIIRYVQALKKSEACPVKPTDIGIISPYKKQVEKIRLLLRRLSIDDIKVGSVEEFQGQERPVIIISTVRSNQSYVGSDVDHSIGFLSNPKRFNVAITRAQSLLVVIGNPHVLCQDPYWCSLVHYCVMKDVYTGCDLPDLDSELYQEEFHYAMNVLSQIETKDDASDVESGNDESTIDECYQPRSEDPDHVIRKLPRNMNLSDDDQSLKRNSKGREQCAPECSLEKQKYDQNEEDLVTEQINPYKKTSVALDHFLDSKACAHITSFDGNVLKSRKDDHRSNPALDLSDNTGDANGLDRVVTENNLKGITVDPSNAEDFSSALSGSADVCESRTGQESNGTTGHTVQGNEKRQLAEVELINSNARDDITSKESTSFLSSLDDNTSQDNISRSNSILKHLELPNHQSEIDVSNSAQSNHVMTSSTLAPIDDSCDEDDLEEFMIKPIS